jgi:hypothetical protein
VAIVQDPALEAEADRMGRKVADEVWSGQRVGGSAMADRGALRLGMTPVLMRRPVMILEPARAMQPRSSHVRGGFGRPPAAERQPRSAAVVQPMRGIDLEAMSTQALKDVGVESATEVQAMNVDGQVAMTANSPASMSTLSPSQLLNLCAMPGLWKLANVKSAVSAVDCAAKLAVADRSLIILKGDDFVGVDVHAEQRLLVALAFMLKNKKVPDTVHVWGAKPPCGSCKKVLAAFREAMLSVYDKYLIYSNVEGQARQVPRISMAKIFGTEEPGDFGRFVAIYTAEMSKG